MNYRAQSNSEVQLIAFQLLPSNYSALGHRTVHFSTKQHSREGEGERGGEREKRDRER